MMLYLKKNYSMKKLLKVACIAALLILASCSPKQKSNEIWFKVSEDADFNLTRLKQKDGWYVLKFAESEKHDGVLDFNESLENYIENSHHDEYCSLGYITDIELTPAGERQCRFTPC